jgi:2-dehydro-3-deoxy-D-arabinonate dehydratase
MPLCRYRSNEAGAPARWGWIESGALAPLGDAAVHAVLTAPGAGGLNDLAAAAQAGDPVERIALPAGADLPVKLLAPVDPRQEVWAAGVTYESSKLARMAESKEAGDFYGRVYLAQRPELFFKALGERVVGPDAQVRIRADSFWNVPEPELAVVMAATGRVLGFTVGNDMSSRDIEGENPLYLPQAKVYRGSCALGPVIVPAESVDPQNLTISLSIVRDGHAVFEQSTSTARMRRTVAEIVPWLFRENDFPHGVVLLTGTGIVPGDDFTLQLTDVVTIGIEGIGTLRNVVG